MPHSRNSQINDIIRQATPKHPASPPLHAPQAIHGNGNIGNIVAGGNVTNVYRGGMPVEPSNQNMTECPACGAPVSITANACLACGDNLANRRLVAWQAACQRRTNKLMSLIGIPSLAAIYIGDRFNMPYLTMAGAAGVLLVLLIARDQ
ncbi:MAG: zinc ribbon domain-containing protein [Oxalobacteraceae bacterium]|nr:zinc ribbon domain-containing protein [Oxalobacteraceae bacterium]